MPAQEMHSLAGQNSRKYSKLGSKCIVQHTPHQLGCMGRHFMNVVLMKCGVDATLVLMQRARTL